MTQENLDEFIAFVEGEREKLKDIAEDAGRLIAWTEALAILKAASVVRESEAKHIWNRLHLNKSIYSSSLDTSKKEGDKIIGSIANGELKAIDSLMKLVANLAKAEKEETNE